MKPRSIVIALVVVALLAGGALYARHHGYRVIPIAVRVMHGQH